MLVDETKLISKGDWRVEGEEPRSIVLEGFLQQRTWPSFTLPLRISPKRTLHVCSFLSRHRVIAKATKSCWNSGQIIDSNCKWAEKVETLNNSKNCHVAFIMTQSTYVEVDSMEEMTAIAQGDGQWSHSILLTSELLYALRTACLLVDVRVDITALYSIVQCECLFFVVVELSWILASDEELINPWLTSKIGGTNNAGGWKQRPHTRIDYSFETWTHCPLVR